MLTLTDIGLSALLAVTAYVYSQVLTSPEMILSGLYQYLERNIGHIRWLFKPLIDCCYCVAGQLAFWTYSITNAYDLNLLSLVNFVCLTIFLTEATQKIWLWKNN